MRPESRRRRGLRRARTVAAVFACAACTTCGLFESAPKPTPGVTPNLVLVTIDTLRADHLSAWGYGRETTPHLSAWLDEGTIFEDAYSPLPLTDPSMTSIMTGLEPIHHGVRHVASRLPESVTTLAEVLGERGWATAAFLSREGLAVDHVLARGFDVADFEGGDATGMTGKRARAERAQRRGEQVADAAIGWLEARPAGPFFLWLHLFDPHAFYDPPPPFRDRFGRDAVEVRVEGVRAWWGRVDDVGALHALYDEEILTADHHLDRVVAVLRSQGVFDDTLFVLTSDHGESLAERGFLDHGEWLYQEQVHVPLFMRQPGRIPSGLRVAGAVRLIDLAPTILELLDVEGADVDALVAAMDGESLAGVFRGDALAPRRVFIESESCPRGLGSIGAPGMECHPPGVEGKLRGVIDGRWKLLIRPLRDGRVYELYDLEADPWEEHDLARTEPERVRALEQLVDARWQTAPALEPTVDAHTMEQLEALGYTE